MNPSREYSEFVHPSGAETKCLVSVLIPTYNSASHLGKAIESVGVTRFRNIEVWVLDGGSSDDTVRLALSKGCRTIVSQISLSAQRKLGTDVAKGQFVLFLDSDQELSKGAIDHCVWLCESLGLDAVIIPEQSKGESFWAKCLSWDKKLMSSNSGVYEGESPRFFRKAVFDKVKPEGNLLFGDLWEIYLKMSTLGFRVGRATCVMSHNELSSPTATIIKWIRYGESYWRLRNAFKKEASIYGSPARRLRILMKKWGLIRAFRKDPTHIMGLIFLKGITVSSFYFGRLVALLPPDRNS